MPPPRPRPKKKRPLRPAPKKTRMPSLEAPLVAEKQARISRSRPLKVLDHARFGGPEKTGFGSPGSVILFLGRSPKETQQAISALRKGEAAMKSLLKRISDEMDGLEPGTPEDVLASAKGQPVLAALTYGGVPIADPIWLPKGLEMTVVAAPYSGGNLIPQGFQIVEWVKSEDAPRYAAFVLKTSPPLTRAEKVALKKVPKSHRSVHVGGAYKCEMTTVAALAFGVAGAVGGAAAGAGVGGLAGAVAGGVAGGLGGAIVGAAVDAGVVATLEGRQHGRHLHLSGDDVKRMGPARSAKALVEKRRQAMRKAQKGKRKKHG